MPWQLVDPHLYAQHLRHAAPSDGAAEDADALWYQDDSTLSTGELVVQVGRSGDLLWFQLSHTKWPHGHEHLAEWRRGSGLRVGEVRDGEGERSHRRNMSPTVHYVSNPDQKLASELIDYFLSHSAVLETSLREEVAKALWRGLMAVGAAE